MTRTEIEAHITRLIYQNINSGIEIEENKVDFKLKWFNLKDE